MWTIHGTKLEKYILGFCILSDSHSYNASVGYFAILCFSDSHPGLQMLGNLEKEMCDVRKYFLKFGNTRIYLDIPTVCNCRNNFLNSEILVFI